VGISLIHSCASLIRGGSAGFDHPSRHGLYLKPRSLSREREKSETHTRSVSATGARPRAPRARVLGPSPQGRPVRRRRFLPLGTAVGRVPPRGFPNAGWYCVAQWRGSPVQGVLTKLSRVDSSVSGFRRRWTTLRICRRT